MSRFGSHSVGGSALSSPFWGGFRVWGFCVGRLSVLSLFRTSTVRSFGFILWLREFLVRLGRGSIAATGTPGLLRLACSLTQRSVWTRALLFFSRRTTLFLRFALIVWFSFVWVCLETPSVLVCLFPKSFLALSCTVASAPLSIGFACFLTKGISRAGTFFFSSRRAFAGAIAGRKRKTDNEAKEEQTKNRLSDRGRASLGC